MLWAQYICIKINVESVVNDNKTSIFVMLQESPPAAPEYATTAYEIPANTCTSPYEAALSQTKSVSKLHGFLIIKINGNQLAAAFHHAYA